VHSQELQTLRSTSNATIEQIQSANVIALENLKADHAASLENEVNSLQKQITKLNIELKATQDDLAKAKASLEMSRAEVETVTKQRDAAVTQAEAAPSLSPEHAEEFSRLTKELSISKDDLVAVTDMLNLTKSTISELSDNHKKELEEAARIRADEIIKLRAANDSEVSTFATQKSELLVKLSDLEGELATVKAALAAQGSSPPKSNGNGISPPTSLGVTKEELTKLHEAHNLKIYDLQAEHDKSAKHAKEELDTAYAKINELQQDIARKAMEIQYLEQEQDESQEQITRYVRLFGFKGFVGGILALAMIHGFF
jgi:DNA repair exonuclease SbcCD ATPase subunit